MPYLPPGPRLRVKKGEKLHTTPDIESAWWVRACIGASLAALVGCFAMAPLVGNTSVPHTHPVSADTE